MNSIAPIVVKTLKQASEMENRFEYCINSNEKYTFLSGDELHSRLSVMDTISFDILKYAHIEFFQNISSSSVDWIIDEMKKAKRKLRLYDKPMFIIISRNINRNSIEYKLARVN